MRSKWVVTIVLFLAIFLCSCGGTDFNGAATGGVSTTPTPTIPTTPTPTTVQVSLSSASIANGGTVTATAVVTDATAAVMQNVSVTFSVISATAGTLNPASAITNASGVATSVFTATTPNTTATIRASVAVGSTTISGSAPLTIGTPAQVPASVVVSLSSPSIPTPPGSITVSATVRDASAAAINGASVTFTVSNSSAGNFSSGTASTNASGVATVTFTANAAVSASVTITATAGTLNNSATLSIGSPPLPTPANMTLLASPAQIAITQQSVISVTVLSSTGVAVPDEPVLVTITGGAALGSLSTSPSVTNVNTTTNASGNASVTFYAGISSGVVTITATAGSISKTVSIVLTSSAASVDLTITNPSLINGQTTNITARVLNAANQPVSIGTPVSFTMTYSGTSAPGALSSTTGFTVTSGDARVTFTADKVNTGPVFIMASAGTVSSSLQIIQVDPAVAGSLLYMSAVPAIIGIAGSGSITDSVVTFQVMNSAGGPLANQSVKFEIVSGPPDAKLDSSGGPISTGSTGLDGKVSTILHAGMLAGQVMIKATTRISDIPLVELSTSAGAITIGGGTPSDRFFSVTTSRYNLEGIYDTNLIGNGLGCAGVTTSIQAFIADRFGNSNILEGTSVSFNTDAGAINAGNVTDAAGFTVSEYRTQDPSPIDVTPIAGEPFYVDGSGRTRNPRDGWISILVRVGGEEHFTDVNGNGNYDTLEPFIDKPEAFIDSNDNNLWDTNELFFDWPTGVPGNSVGTYNNIAGLGNGVWDARTDLFRNIHLAMTGPPHVSSNTTHVVNSSGGTGPILLSAGESEVFTVYVSDINMNSLMPGTKISADMTGFIEFFTTPPYRVDLVAGSDVLADGLSFGPTVLQYRVTNTQLGPPDETGTLTVAIDWPGSCGSATTKVSYPSGITLFAPLAISTTALSNGTVGVVYSQTIVATGGVTPLTWALTGGSLPPGLAFNPATNSITGTPTIAGVSGFDLTVTDSVGAQATQTFALTIN